MPELAEALVEDCSDRATPAVTPHGRVEGVAQYCPVSLSIYDDFAEVEEAWLSFQQHADGTPFQSYEWLSAWHRHIGTRQGITPAIVFGHCASGDVLFIFPLAVTAGRVRRLTWLGSDLCDYNAPLLAENFADFVPAKRFASLWHDIRRLLGEADIFRHDAVELTKMPERGGEQPNPFLSLNVALHPSGAHIVHLTGNWNDFYKSRRSSTTRQRDRTKYNRLRDLGEVRFVTAHNSFDIGEVVETLFEQKTKSFARMGIANIFEEDGCREFFFDFATSPDSRHLTHVSSLQVGGICAATNLALCFSGRYYHVLASHDDGLISRFGPGAAHLRHLLRHAFEHGYRQFDFTIGDEAYKLEWADTNLKLYDHIAPATLRGWPLAAGAAMRGRVKRVIKQTPMLWQSFKKMRARLAGWTKHRESTGRARGGRLQDSPSIMPD